MRKVCFVITTRGNYAKLKTVLSAARQHPGLEVQLVVGGGAVLHKYGNIIHAVEAAGFPVDHIVHFLLDGETPVTMSKSAGLAVVEFSTIFEKLKPDLVFVIADRFEMLAVAMAASYMNIPLAHMEGGEVSGSIDESIRHAITKLSHLHFPATEDAARRIDKLGEHRDSVHVVGCTSFDAMREIDLENLDAVQQSQSTMGTGPILDLSQPYLVVIQHPVTTEYEANYHHASLTIQAVEKLAMNTVWIWPNMDAGSDGISKAIRVFRESKKPEYVHFFTSLSIELYGPLLNKAACIIGNSSSGLREAAFLGTPSVNIGSRQTGREIGKNVIHTGYDSDNILEAIQRQLAHGKYEPDYTYGDGRSGRRIADILADAPVCLQKLITY